VEGPNLNELIANLVTARRELISQLLEAGQPQNKLGIEWCSAHCVLADTALKSNFDSYLDGAPISLLAVGGYGRKELAPFSDIDIVLSYTEDLPSDADAAAKKFFRSCEAQITKEMGLEVSGRLQQINEVATVDIVSRTSMIDARFLAGSAEIFAKLKQRLRVSHSAGEFLVYKIAERNSEVLKSNETPLVAEPNLKFGRGGLRDWHLASWMQFSAGFDDEMDPSDIDLIFACRNILHAVASSKTDRLTRAKAASVAEILRMDLVDLYKDLGRALEGNWSRLQAVLSGLTAKTWPFSAESEVRNGLLHVVSDDIGTSARLTVQASRLNIQFSPDKPLIGESLRGSEFVYALSYGYSGVLTLERSGHLAATLPELEACRYLLSRDSVHKFSVYQHTLYAVQYLTEESGISWLDQLRSELRFLPELTLATLLHDVGKIDPTRPHSIVGAEICQNACKRLRLPTESAELICWLVEHHLAMAQVMRLRDLEHPDTIREFREFVHTTERLGLLTLLTYADMRAVNDGVWSAAQESFLRTLYERTRASFESAESGDQILSFSRTAVARQLNSSAEDDDSTDELIQRLPAYYLASTSPRSLAVHAKYIAQAERGQVVIEIEDVPDKALTEFTICAPDRAGLLYQILGVLYAFDLTVPVIRVCTATGQNPVALDVIECGFGRNPVPAATKRLSGNKLEAVLYQRETVEKVLLAHEKSPDRQPEILSWTFTPGDVGLLELVCRRGRGIPYRLSRWISLQGWRILSARVGQWADRAAATFYIQCAVGSMLTREEIEAAIPTRET
jgi:[protein-PII] uridylyltransferase